MGYRIYSDVLKSKFWYVAIPKTGSQAVRKVFDDLMPQENIMWHFTQLWHLSTQDMLLRTRRKRPDVDKMSGHLSPDATRNHFFFTTIRNPWERAYSFYKWQKKQIERKLKAYESKEEGDKFILEFPRYEFNFDNKEEIKFLENSYSKFFKDFETYMNTIEVSYNMIEADNVKKYIRQMDRENWMSYHYQPTMTYISSTALINNFIFKIEEPDKLIDFLEDCFNLPKDDVSNILCNQKVNVTGMGKEYRDHYSEKMKKTIYDLEYTIINKFGYKF